MDDNGKQVMAITGIFFYIWSAINYVQFLKIIDFN